MLRVFLGVVYFALIGVLFTAYERDVASLFVAVRVEDDFFVHVLTWEGWARIVIAMRLAVIVVFRIGFVVVEPVLHDDGCT